GLPSRQRRRQDPHDPRARLTRHFSWLRESGAPVRTRRALIDRLSPCDLMYRVNERAIVFLPWNAIEPEAQQQILNTAKMPFIFKHVAVMPDCHYGKGATVGTVLATKGAVIPAAVGVDIG